jgi:hypothetical protein
MFMRVYANQAEASGTDFLRYPHSSAPLRIEKLLAGIGSQSARRHLQDEAATRRTRLR